MFRPHIDPVAARRQRAALAWTLVLVAAGAGFTAGVGFWHTKQLAPAPPPLQEEPMIELVQLEQPVDLELPSPPPPPAALGEAHGDDSVDDDPQPAELQEVVEPRIQSSAAARGTADGTAGGDPDGEPEGIIGGTPRGTGDRLGDASLRAPFVEAMSPRQMPAPQHPKELTESGRVTCRADLWVDARGRVTRVEVRGCPEAFATNTKTALLRWKFAPHRVDGEARAARTAVRVQFRER